MWYSLDVCSAAYVNIVLGILFHIEQKMIIVIKTNYTVQKREKDLDRQRNILDMFRSSFASEQEWHYYDQTFAQPGDSATSEIIRTLGPEDTLIVGSLLDLASDHIASLEILERVHQTGCTIFLYGIDADAPFAEYRDRLYHVLGFDPYSHLHQRRTKYPIKLLEYAAKLREKQPQVAYADISKYTGIPRTAIHNYILRTRPELPERHASRAITAEEIEEIKKIASEA